MKVPVDNKAWATASLFATSSSSNSPLTQLTASTSLASPPVAAPVLCSEPAAKIALGLTEPKIAKPRDKSSRLSNLTLPIEVWENVLQHANFTPSKLLDLKNLAPVHPNDSLETFQSALFLNSIMEQYTPEHYQRDPSNNESLLSKFEARLLAYPVNIAAEMICLYAHRAKGTWSALWQMMHIESKPLDWIMAAVRIDAHILKVASYEARDDYMIAAQAIKSWKQQKEWHGYPKRWPGYDGRPPFPFAALSGRLRKDLGLIKLAFANDLCDDDETLKYIISENFRSKEFVTYLVDWLLELKELHFWTVSELDIDVVRRIPQTFLDDATLVRKLVEVDSQALGHMPMTIKNDPELVKIGLELNWRQLIFLSEEQRNDWDLVLVACSLEQEAIKLASPQLQASLPFYRAIAETASCLQECYLTDWVPPAFQLDEELMLTIIKNSNNSPVDLEGGLKHSLSFARKALAAGITERGSDSHNWFYDLKHSFSPEIWGDFEFSLEILTRHRDVATLALDDTSDLKRGFRAISEELKQDQEFLKKALRLDGRLLCALSEQQRNDPILVKAALSQRLDVWPMAHASLRQNPDFARHHALLTEADRRKKLSKDSQP